MNARFLWVAGATVLAAGVFALATVFDGSGPKTAPGPVPAPPDVQGFGVSQNDLDTPNDGTVAPIAGAQGFEVFSDDGETVTRFTGDELTPQADFVADVTRPVAEMRFSESKLLLITAASGRFHHPGNVPTRGEFNANTVVTQYQAPDGQPVDLDSDQHIQFRLYLDDLTTFDQQRGHIYSQGPVRLVAPDLDFTGQGLDLTFNRLRERIEELIIERGDELRIAADAGLTATTDGPPQSDSAELTTSEAPTQGTGTSVPVDAPDNTPAPQHYHATLLDNIQITVGAEDATLTGDRLEATFALNPAPGSSRSARAKDAATRAYTGPTHQDPPFYYINAHASSDPRGLMSPSPDDVVVQWSGRLEMRPLAEPHPELVTADDAVFRLHGGEQPARYDTANDEHIAAAIVGYRTAGREVFAEESDAHPLALRTPDLGELSATTLSINQDLGQGQLAGPGRLLTDNDELDVTFRDQLDLAFAPNAEGRLDAIESATFRGEVHAQTQSPDPEQNLDLSSETLALTLTPDAQGTPQPTQLQAAARPGQLVTALQGENTTFQAEQLDIDLAPAPTQGTGTSVPVNESLDTSEFEVTRLRAFRQVRVERPDEQLTLTAHALDADPRINSLSLFGENERSYATLTRGEDTLAGVHLILVEAEQTADALGPGRFSARTDENDPTARLNVQWTENMEFNNVQGTALFVGSVESMSTSATDDTSLSAHRLALEFVPQDFENPAPGSGTSVPVSDPPNLQPPTPDSTILDLRRVHAVADPDNAEASVKFRAQTFAADDAAQSPLTRITVDGRELIFINQPPNLTNDSPIDDHISVERLIIPTRGRLLLEDYRTPPPPEVASGAANGQGENADGNAEATPGPIAFAGRGQTLFDWGKSLSLDLITNNLRIEGQGDLDVYMAHNPDPTRSDPSELVTLQSQVLVADLTETGGLGAYVNGQPPDIQIQNVTATGRIRLKQNTTNLEADHMEYEAAKRSVLFWAEPRRRAQLSLDRTVTTAKGYRWDLDTNEFSAIEPGSNVIPVE